MRSIADHEVAGGQAAEVVLALEQQHLGARAPCGECRCAARGPAPHHQYLGLRVDRRLARPLGDRQPTRWGRRALNASSCSRAAAVDIEAVPWW